MERICAILDADADYATRLMDAVRHRRGCVYQTAVFTKQDELLKYLEDNTPEVLVVSEDMVTSEVRSAYTGRCVVLTEEEQKEGICRYQSAVRIVNEIVKDMPFTGSTSAEKEAEIVGIYSPINCAGKTSLSLAIAKAYERAGKNVVYMNLEEFSGLSEILPEQKGSNLSDFVYRYKKAPAFLEGEFEHMLCMRAGVYYIPPVRCAEDISFVSPEEWGEVFHMLARSFEVIVADISGAVKRPWQLLEFCTRVLLPVKEDYISSKKINAFKVFLLEMGKEDLGRELEEVILPRDKNLQLCPDFLEQSEYGMLGRYARELAGKGGGVYAGENGTA